VVGQNAATGIAECQIDDRSDRLVGLPNLVLSAPLANVSARTTDGGLELKQRFVRLVLGERVRVVNTTFEAKHRVHDPELDAQWLPYPFGQPRS
jgi:hypothetical protein